MKTIIICFGALLFATGASADGWYPCPNGGPVSWDLYRPRYCEGQTWGKSECIQENCGRHPNNQTATWDADSQSCSTWDPLPESHPHSAQSLCFRPRFVPRTSNDSSAQREPEPQSRPEPEVEIEFEPEVVETPPVVISYTMTFPEGENSLSLPIGTAFLKEIFGWLGDDANTISGFRPTVQRWTTVKCASQRHDNYVGRGDGFVADMEVEREVTLTARQRLGTTYAIIYLRKGMNVIGVPLESPHLDTVGEFYSYFRHADVQSVQVKADGELVTPAMSDAIKPDAGYYVTVGKTYQREVWGTQWSQPQASAAPGIVRVGKLATTWGALKSSGQ